MSIENQLPKYADNDLHRPGERFVPGRDLCFTRGLDSGQWLGIRDDQPIWRDGKWVSSAWQITNSAFPGFYSSIQSAQKASL